MRARALFADWLASVPDGAFCAVARVGFGFWRNIIRILGVCCFYFFLYSTYSTCGYAISYSLVCAAFSKNVLLLKVLLFARACIISRGSGEVSCFEEYL